MLQMEASIISRRCLRREGYPREGEWNTRIYLLHSPGMLPLEMLYLLPHLWVEDSPDGREDSFPQWDH
jgi:hypothetical protein